MRGIGGKIDVALCENITLLVESIGLVDPFRIHQVGRVPTSRSVEDGVIGSIVSLGFSGRGVGRSRKADWGSDAESGHATEFKEFSSHGFAGLFVKEVVLAKEVGDDGPPRPESVVGIVAGSLPRDATGIDFDRFEFAAFLSLTDDAVEKRVAAINFGLLGVPQDVLMQVCEGDTDRLLVLLIGFDSREQEALSRIA
jgi:hypothetical protein